MKKVYCLFAMMLLGHQLLIAQSSYNFGINFAGTYYPDGSTVVLPCGVQTVRAFVQSDNAPGTPGYKNGSPDDLYPASWQIAQENNSVSRDFNTSLSGGGVIAFKGIVATVGFGITQPFDVQITVVRPVPNLSVSGDPLICSGQTKTYTLSGASAGDQINWSSSLPGSSNGTQFNATGNGNNGPTFVTANVMTANGCGTFAASQAVQVGPQSAVDIVGMSPGAYFSAGQTVNLYVNESVLAYNWSVSGGTITGSSTSQYITVTLDNCFNGQTANNNFSANVNLTNECGTGNTYNENTYAVCDGSTPLGRQASAEKDRGFSVVVYPNPVGKQFSVGINGAAGQSVQFRLTNLRGQTVIEQQAQVATNAHTEILDLPTSAIGLYLLQVSTPTQSQTVKVAKTE